MPIDALPRAKHAHEFIGADHGGVPVSLIFVAGPRGAGPALHHHPYAELFIVVSGEATFHVGDEKFVARAGELVVGPPDVPHGFTNSGTTELRLTAIHCAPTFTTVWEAEPDPLWVSQSKRSR